MQVTDYERKSACKTEAMVLESIACAHRGTAEGLSCQPP